MSWLQLRINSTREHAEAVENALLTAGAASVTMEDNADQPILEPAIGETPLWNNTRITGLFTANTDTTQATIIATANYGSTLPDYRWELLEDKDWEREWMDAFQPMQFGRRLWICPSWKQPPAPHDVNLMLDPGLAFGTGTHPTTALCLEWLDSCDLADKIIIDYGCGSGILGIAALLLGAKQVIAIDNDPQALIATTENAERNHIASHKIQTFLPENTPKTHKADIVIANILAGPLLELAPLISQYVQQGGQIALSGIIEDQAAALTACYSEWFDMAATNNHQEWIRLNGTKR